MGEPGTVGRGQYESAFAIAIRTDEEGIREARQIAHDTVIANSGRARRSGVRWTHHPARTAVEALRDYGIDDMPEVAQLCALVPHGVLVMATVEVDESVTP